MKPEKYYKGLTRKNRVARLAKFGAMNWKDPKAYVGFRTDRGVRTRKSSYTEQWFRLFPNARSLKEKASVAARRWFS